MVSKLPTQAPTDIAMEFFLSLPLLLFYIFLACLSFHILLKKLKPQNSLVLGNDQKTLLPPGRIGWPLIGETLDYLSKARSGLLENFVNDRKEKYSSKVFKTSLLGQPMAILCGPEGNKFLFSNEKKLVQVWFPCYMDKIFPKSQGESNAESALKFRKMLPMLKVDTLKNYVGVMDAVMKQHLETDWDNRKQVNVQSMVRKSTLMLACRLFLSIDDPAQVEQFGNSIQHIDTGTVSLPINIPGTAMNRAVKAAKLVRNEIEALVRQRKVDILDKASSKQDLLSHLLLTDDGDGHFLNEFDISSHLLGMMMAGYSTINGTQTFIMNYLAELPDVYNQVFKEQVEIRNSKNPKELLNWEDLRKMKNSWNVANEVLRLMPPGPGMFREAITDFAYAGYMIPKGWKIHYILHATHKDPKYFPNPEKFNPKRFEGNGPAPYTFIPFGGGPRMCPGAEYARLAILIFMHNVVTKFRWEKVIPNEKILSNPNPRFVHGLPVHLHPHNF